MATIFESPADLEKSIGKQFGSSDWIEITQERIDRFAEATEDFQWIHTDPERAKAGPFGKTIAHGYLTQSLASLFLSQVIEVRGIVMAINYGSNKVRFLQPVKVNQRIRAVATVMDITEKKPGQYLFRKAITIQIDGEDTPALVAEILSLFIVQ